MKALEIRFKVKNSKSEWVETHTHKMDAEGNEPKEVLQVIFDDFNKSSQDKRELVEVIAAKEIELFICSMCGKESTDSDDFETDFGSDDDMTCETCYNDMDEDDEW